MDRKEEIQRLSAHVLGPPLDAAARDLLALYKGERDEDDPDSGDEEKLIAIQEFLLAFELEESGTLLRTKELYDKKGNAFYIRFSPTREGILLQIPQRIAPIRPSLVNFANEITANDPEVSSYLTGNLLYYRSNYVYSAEDNPDLRQMLRVMLRLTSAYELYSDGARRIAMGEDLGLVMDDYFGLPF